MTADELRDRLQGVIAFPVTPFHRDMSLDIAGLRSNLRELMKHPIATIGEAGGRVPVICGTGFNQQIAIDLAQRPAAVCADAILAMPPYSNADTEGLATTTRPLWQPSVGCSSIPAG
jgi:5-dehydro-4-deoxyglucarate dehydratase